MNLKEGKQKFIQSWGTLGSSWGINRTMAQIHALLLVAPEALSSEEIMSELKISRGNVNMNLRELMNWNLVKKELKAGERKEFFNAEKDMWVVFRLIVKERRKRELEPMLKIIEELTEVKGNNTDKNFEAFNSTIKDIYDFSSKADKTLDTLIKADENWFLGTFLKLIK